MLQTGYRTLIVIVRSAQLALPRLPECSFPCNVLDLLEFCAHLDDRVSNQARVERHRLPQRMLCACARVEAHNEVVAVMVSRLQFLRGLG